MRSQTKLYRRFIPTPVGNALAGESVPAPCAVHPHARGERLGLAHSLYWPVGSSPRPWGTPQSSARRGRSGRFIPTPVGNAPSWSTSRGPGTVHPHARGERSARRPGPRCAAGSSPRPWGTRTTFLGESIQRRFIPTPVGNAHGRTPCASTGSVHPHARGERCAPRISATVAAGSSPRPWGTRHADRPVCVRDRFIPTPVGNA